MTKFNTILHGGMLIHLPVEDGITSSLIHQGIADGWYEMAEGRLAQQILSRDDVVLELGGGLGCLMVYICLSVSPSAYFCIEADERLIEFIETALKLNNVADVDTRLIIQNLVLTNDQTSLINGSTTFFLGNEFWVSSTVNRQENMRSVENVEVQDFNEFVEFNKISALICDIEGGEVDIFCAHRDLPDSIKKIVVEIHPDMIGENEAIEVMNSITGQRFVLEESVQTGTTRVCSFSR